MDNQGQKTPIKNEKDVKIVDMKLRGYSNSEIADAVGFKEKTIRNITSRGGRLYPTLEELRNEKCIVLYKDNIESWEKLEEAKDPCIEELKRIALESPNDVARLKAIDMVLELTGLRGEKPPLLDPSDFEKSSERFVKWANQRFNDVFKDKASSIFIGERNSLDNGINNGLGMLSYLEHKKLIWEYEGLNEEQLKCALSKIGFDVEAIENRCVEANIDTRPWFLFFRDKDKALEFKKATENKHRIRRNAIKNIAIYLRRHLLLLSSLVAAYKDDKDIKSLKKLMKKIFKCEKQEIDEIITNLLNAFNQEKLLGR